MLGLRAITAGACILGIQYDGTFPTAILLKSNTGKAAGGGGAGGATGRAPIIPFTSKFSANAPITTMSNIFRPNFIFVLKNPRLAFDYREKKFAKD
jgi:hypothetical protein